MSFQTFLVLASMCCFAANANQFQRVVDTVVVATEGLPVTIRFVFLLVHKYLRSSLLRLVF